MTQQPAMPSRHVCQVKYRKVGLQQGGGDTRYHVVLMLPVGRAQQGKLCQRETPATPNDSAVPAQGKSGTLCTRRRSYGGEMVSPRALGSLYCQPWANRAVMATGLALSWHTQVILGNTWQHQQSWCPLILVQEGRGREARSCYFL